MSRIPTTELVNKIFAFCEAYSGVAFFPYQAQFAKRIIRSVLENDGEEISALFSRQSGKSETVATVSGGLAIILPTLANMPMFAEDSRLQPFKNGVLIGIFAPALHQAQISFNRLKERMFSKHSMAVMEDPDIQVSLDTNNGQNVALSNGSVITCMSASEGSNIEGKSYMIVIIDEAQDVSNFKYTKSIFPMGAFYNATYILIGTPTTSKGFFYHSIERNKREHMNGGKRNHFEYGYLTVLKYNPKYGKHIEGAMRKLGEDSDEFQMSYNLKWILERGMFVNSDTFDRLGEPNLGTVLVDMQKKHTVGIDCGKKNDSTVITIVEVDYDNPVIVEAAKDMNTPDYITYNTTIKAWLELVGDNYEEQYPEVLSFISNFNVVRIAIDATGAGSPIADRLAANVDCEVIPYVFGSVSKSILYKHFDAEIKSKRFRYPANEETKQSREYYRFMEQMEELQKTYSGQHLVVSHPDERGKHDDYPDSAALAVWAAKGEDVSKPQNERNPFQQHKTEAHNYYVSRNKYTARRR